MSLFESASLVVTPNGTKASKLYAIKPTSGAGDLTVTRATTATRVNSAGLIESVAVNVPRLDYTNSTCPSILVDPQRTNLTLYSEDLTNVYWNKQNTTITPNAINSPSGVQNADLVTENTLNADHSIFDVVSYFVTGTTYTTSFYAKANGRTKIELVSAASGTCPTGRFDLIALTATPTNTSFNAKIENAGNGWFKCSVSRVAPNTGVDLPYYAMVQTFGTISYLGNGTSGMYFWGMQTEVGSYSTSYIPTVASAVTRNADVISKTGISSLLNSTQGTFYVEVERIGASGADFENVLFVSDTSLNNFVNIVFDVSTSRYRGQVREGGTTSGLVIATSAYTGRLKIAIAYAANDLVLYINGIQQALDTSVTMPSVALNSLGLGGVFDGTYFDTFRGNYKTTAIWKNRISNAELAELTTI
jgi:hypothetical protein